MSRNHWSEAIRSQQDNGQYLDYIYMSSTAYENKDGEDAYNQVFELHKDPSAFKLWQQGKVNLANGCWITVGVGEVGRNNDGYYDEATKSGYADAAGPILKPEFVKFGPGPGKVVEPKEDEWGWGTYLGGTFAPVAGPTVEVGCLVDSKGHILNYLSVGIAFGGEISAGGGTIVVPYKNFSAQNWLGDGFGASCNIPMTPFSIEYAQSLYNTTYRAFKTGVGVGVGGSVNLSYTIILPVVPPEVWVRPGQPR